MKINLTLLQFLTDRCQTNLLVKLLKELYFYENERDSDFIIAKKYLQRNGSKFVNFMKA